MGFEHGISTLVPPAQKKARETLKFWRFFLGKLVGTHETEVGLAIYVLHRILLLVDPTRGTYFHQSLAPVFVPATFLPEPLHVASTSRDPACAAGRQRS